MSFDVLDHNSAYQAALRLMKDMDAALQFSRAERKAERGGERAPEPQYLLDRVLAAAQDIARAESCRASECRTQYLIAARENVFACLPILDRIRDMGILVEKENSQFREDLAALERAVAACLTDAF